MDQFYMQNFREYSFCGCIKITINKIEKDLEKIVLESP